MAKAVSLIRIERYLKEMAAMGFPETDATTVFLSLMADVPDASSDERVEQTAHEILAAAARARSCLWHPGKSCAHT